MDRGRAVTKLIEVTEKIAELRLELARLKAEQTTLKTAISLSVSIDSTPATREILQAIADLGGTATNGEVATKLQVTQSIADNRLMRAVKQSRIRRVRHGFYALLDQGEVESID